MMLVLYFLINVIYNDYNEVSTMWYDFNNEINLFIKIKNIILEKEKHKRKMNQFMNYHKIPFDLRDHIYSLIY